MPPVQYIAKTIVTARDAIASLVRWKITLSMATRMREPLSERATRSIWHPDECSIGQWLLSRHTQHLRGTPEYRAMFDRHADFHREMQSIARLINAAEYAAAERLLDPSGSFEKTANAVANAIMALERAPAGKLAS